MLPFYPAAPGNFSPPLIEAQPGSASEALQRLAALHSVGISEPIRPGYFNQYDPPHYSHPADKTFIECRQPSGFVWSVNPVFGVRPIMHPVNTTQIAPTDSSTGAEAVTPANSPDPGPHEATGSDQIVVNEEIEADEVDDIGGPLNEDRTRKAVSTQFTARDAIKVSSDPPRRITFSVQQLRIMRNRFDTDHYIDRSEATELANELGITVKSLLNWFANERRRFKLTSGFSTPPGLTRPCPPLARSQTSLPPVKSKSGCCINSQRDPAMSQQ